MNRNAWAKKNPLKLCAVRVFRMFQECLKQVIGGGVQPRVNLSSPNACEPLRAVAKTYQNPLFGKHLIRKFTGCFVADRVDADAGSIAGLGIELEGVPHDCGVNRTANPPTSVSRSVNKTCY